ncbi:MAG: branched-chain amino acid ABC transporter permease [Castellaniella sp.]|nr:branched-chain amino acid ABC transporter permease [Castellaniella sp.]
MKRHLFSGTTLVAAVVLGLVLVPLLLSNAGVGVLSQMLIFALFALAFSLLAGQGGMLSFGHAAFFAMGCFATIHVMKLIEDGALWLPTPLLPLAGGLAGLLLAAVAGYFATLRTGVYFAMITLAVAELLYVVAPSLEFLFGGESGLSSMRMPWAGITFGSPVEVYYLVLAWVLLGTIALYAYTRTSFGRLTVALRESERRVAFLGYNMHKTKLMVFIVSGLFSGVAGGLLAVTNESANYLLFGMGYSADVVLYSYIGGVNLFLGPAVGAAAMVLFGHALSDLTRLWLLYQGLVFVLVMMYAPMGIVGTMHGLSQQWRQGLPGFRLRLCARLVAISVAGAAVVFLCEMLSSILSRDYQAALTRSGIWEPVQVFMMSWAPDRAMTWGVPVVLMALALWALLRSGQGRPSVARSMEAQA